MSSNDKQLIAVIGATGQQGGSVVRALQTSGQFKVRALTRDPGKHRELAEEVVEADLDRPETLKAAFKGAHGVFLVTNFWEIGKKNDELKQATAAVHAAKDAGVKHLVWSTLPNVEAISGGKFHLPHFTGKAKLDKIVQKAGFENHTFVIAPCYYQNFVGTMAPQKQANGSVGWALPIDPNVRCIHMGDIGELGNIVAGAFAHPDQAGNGEYLPLVGDLMSFNQIIDTLNKQGHRYSFSQVPAEAFAASFPGAAEVAGMFGYFEAHTYLGSDSNEEIALANKIAGKQPTNFAAWAQANFPVLTANGTRKVVAIDQFGGIEKMKVQTLSIPEILSDEILVRVESAGVGVWDPFEREGFFAQITNQKPSFPYILGSDGTIWASFR